MIMKNGISKNNDFKNQFIVDGIDEKNKKLYKLIPEFNTFF